MGGRTAQEDRTRGLFPPPEPPKRRVLSVSRFYNNLGYYPHAGQRRLHAAQAKFKVACCGRRWGKSRSGPHDKVPKMFQRQPTLGWIVAPTYDLGEKEFRVFWEILVDKMRVPLDKSKTFNSLRTKDFRITTAWGSSVEVRSAEHPESLVGEGLDWVIMAEAAKLKRSHWEKYIAPTLADRRGEAIFVSTPEGFNWFYDQYMLGQDRDELDWWSIQSPSWHNDIVFPLGLGEPFLQERRKNSSKEVFDQEWGAQFTSFAGRIYSEFDEGYHVLDNYQFDRNKANFLAFDFGFRNPTVCLNIQVDAEDNVFIWDEYYERGKTSVEHARALKEIIQWRVDGAYHDPSGADQANTIRKTWAEKREYHNRFLEKVPFWPAPNDWEAGITRVKEWLKLQESLTGGDPKPKLFVSSRCRNTIREFNQYRVKEQGERAAENTDPKDEPRKKDDHAMDAMRYMIVGKFGLKSYYAYQN